MVITTPDPAPVVQARLHAWSKEWRESRYPAAMRALGHVSWPLIDEGASRYRYEDSLEWPHGIYSGVLHIELRQDADGTFLHCVPRLSPAPLTVGLVGLAIGAISASMGVGTHGLSLRLAGQALLVGGVVSAACFAGRPFAAARFRSRLPRIEAFLRAVVASDPASIAH